MKSGLLDERAGERRAPRTSHAHVVQVLGREIVRGDHAVGSLMPGDSELMARFGVSRTVLREALKTLTAKGFLQPKAKIGTRVLGHAAWNYFDADVLKWHFEIGISRDFLKSLSEIRAAVEPEAAALAARRRSAEDVALLYGLADRMADPGNTPESFAVIDVDFHIAVADASRNPFMRSVNGLVEVALVAAFKITAPTTSPERIAESAADHRRIVDAIAAGDEAAARRTMLHVIEVGEGRVREARALTPSG